MDQTPYSFRRERRYIIPPTHAEPSSAASQRTSKKPEISAPSQHIADLFNKPHMTVEERLEAYLAFFREVVPEGLVAIHAPHETSRYYNSRGPKREEIRIQTYAGKIFMAGLVGSLDRHSISNTELIAAGEAMNKNEFFDVQGLKEWNFFTAHEHLTFFTGELLDGECVEDYSQDTIGEGDEREMASFDPVMEEEGVREYLKRKWDVIPVEDR